MEAFPYPDVDSSLRAMAGQAEGFGRSAVGGLHGSLYSVTTLAEVLLDPSRTCVLLEDDGPGSLREACSKTEPLWIVFDVSGIIHLSSDLSVSSFKTLDGRGSRIKLTGRGLRLQECEHVIICNLEFEAGRGHDVDGIQIQPSSKHIWIDRCSLRDYDEGLIDITRQSTDITVSRCYFTNQDKAMLIGASPSHFEDRCIRVTIHHCFFDGTRQRQPRVRFGKVHLYNNYTKIWGVYAICASVESQIFSQCNIYEAGEKKKAFDYYPELAIDKVNAESGVIRSEGDVFLNGAHGTGTHDHIVFHPSQYYSTWTLETATNFLKTILQACSGYQAIVRPIDESDLVLSPGIQRDDTVEKA